MCVWGGKFDGCALFRGLMGWSGVSFVAGSLAGCFPDKASSTSFFNHGGICLQREARLQYCSVTECSIKCHTYSAYSSYTRILSLKCLYADSYH